MTSGEIAFISFCQCAGIPIEPIEESDAKGPDYQMVAKGRSIIVEVKDFDLNPEEKEGWKLINEVVWHFGGMPPAFVFDTKSIGPGDS